MKDLLEKYFSTKQKKQKKKNKKQTKKKNLTSLAEVSETMIYNSLKVSCPLARQALSLKAVFP